MANDWTLAGRRAVLTAFKADAPLTALVPAASMHPQAPLDIPTWPFIKSGPPSTLPIKAACVDGSEVTVAWHAFAKARVVAGQVVETAEDHCGRIGAAMAKAVDGKRLSIAEGVEARVRWLGSPLLQDGDDPDAFHAIVNLRLRILS